MSTPTVPDSHRDLLDAGTGILATNGADGKPQVTAVSFLYDPSDDRVKISLNDTRQKIKNLRRDPSVTFFILDPANPLRTLEIRGTATIEPDEDFSFVAKAGAKYGQDFRVHDLPSQTRSTVTIEPTRVVATLIG